MSGLIVAGVNGKGEFVNSWAGNERCAWTEAGRLGLVNWGVKTREDLDDSIIHGSSLTPFREIEPRGALPSLARPTKGSGAPLPRIGVRQGLGPCLKHAAAWLN